MNEDLAGEAIRACTVMDWERFVPQQPNEAGQAVLPLPLAVFPSRCFPPPRFGGFVFVLFFLSRAIWKLNRS